MNISPVLAIAFSLPLLIYFIASVIFRFGLMRRRKGGNSTQHFISVVIAARNEEDTLPDLLESLLRQDYPADRYEILVVDDQSDDNTARILSNYAKRCELLSSVHITETPDEYSPKKYALSRGIEKARGEIILTVDADCTVKPTWISTMNSYFEENVGMVVGFSAIRPEDETSFLQRWQSLDFMALMAANEAAMNLGIPLSASGQNLAFTREAFEQVGGYRPISDRATGDDVLLLQLIRNRTDFAIVFAGDRRAHNSTRPETTLSNLLQQRIRWASDAPIQFTMSPLFFVYLLIVFFMYLAVAGGVILAVVNPAFLVYLVPGILLKMSGEYLLLRYATRLYEYPGLITALPVWSLLQIPYVIVTALGGIFYDYNWKGRSRSEAEPFRKRLKR